jgi:nucleolar GTP-binding protein
MSTASKVARAVKADREVKNARNRARKHGAETLNALTQALCTPMRDCVNGYKAEWRRLHPFERVVADLTARARQNQDGLTLSQVLEDIHEARKTLLVAGKDWIAQVKDAPSAKEADDRRQNGMDAIMELYKEVASKPLSDILELQRSLRSAPIVELDTPAVVLVGGKVLFRTVLYHPIYVISFLRHSGRSSHSLIQQCVILTAPNVGKSSIVRSISSGTPEINNYPFTTRGMSMGHVEVFWSDNAAIAKAVIPDGKRRPGSIADDVMIGKYAFSQLCQVMDSPGLLVRPDLERNEMEALTLATMQHLPTAVMYVMDFSGGAGDKCSSVADQLQLRREMRARFPRRPWIDVVSKVDLGIVEGAMEELEEILDGAPCIHLSILENVGVDELRAEVLRMLGEVRVVLDAMASIEVRSPQQTGAR